MATKKRVTELRPGDVIPPPTQDRRWLWKDGIKRMMTVVSVSEGHTDKRGLWMRVVVTFASPYSDRISQTCLDMRPDTAVAAN